MTLASLAVYWDRVPADAASDSEAHHRFARDGLGVRSTAIPVNNRGHPGSPAGRYREQMARLFRPRPERLRSKRVNGQRWAVESAFSRHKRVLGRTLGGKSDASRERRPAVVRQRPADGGTLPADHLGLRAAAVLDLPLDLPHPAGVLLQILISVPVGLP